MKSIPCDLATGGFLLDILLKVLGSAKEHRCEKLMWQVINDGEQREAWVKSIKAARGIGAGNRNADNIRRMWRVESPCIWSTAPGSSLATSSGRTGRGVVPVRLRFVNSMRSGGGETS